MNVGILRRRLSDAMRMTWTVAITALMWSAVPTEGQAQKAIDLPGMLVVAEHHALSEETLQNTWRLHVREAVLVSKGWTWVAAVKGGAELAQTQHVACGDIEHLLLTGEITHGETTTFHPCTKGGFIQLIPSLLLDRLEDRYLINANAHLNQ